MSSKKRNTSSDICQAESHDDFSSAAPTPPVVLSMCEPVCKTLQLKGSAIENNVFLYSKTKYCGANL